MSVVRNFRVTINLSNFFHDHRNRARIFINDDIQTISDLEDRIEKIFNIHNFHLTSQNEFLPPSEDARILQKDDIIWVVQNGENFESVHVPQVSSKVNKKSKRDGKKRSISLTNEYIEEELQSPKKKKKKKCEEKNKEPIISCSTASPLMDEPKKKKKKKRKASCSIISDYPIQDVNMETFSSPVENTDNKSTNGTISNDDRVTTTNEDELNVSKNSVLNINTLLPVLQSHIKTYNEKMTTNQINKPNTSTKEMSSLNLTREYGSGDEKSQYTCKGNLHSYKKKIELPTITDQYLNQKKVNIVKIECLSGEFEAVMDKKKANNEVKDVDKDTSADNNNVAVTEKPITKVIKHNKVLRDNISSSAILGKYLAKGDISKLNTSNKIHDASDFNKSIKPLEATSLDHDEEMTPSKDRLSDKSEINNVRCKSESTFLSNNESAISKSSNANILMNDVTQADQLLSSTGVITSEEQTHSASTSSLDFLTSDNIKSKAAETPTSLFNTTEVVLKKPEVTFHQKYFFFKGRGSTDSINDEKLINVNTDVSISPKNMSCVSPKKEILDVKSQDLVAHSDVQVKQPPIENKFGEIDNSDLKILTSDVPTESNYVNFHNKASKGDVADISYADNLNPKSDHELIDSVTLNDTINQSLAIVDSPQISKEYISNLIIDSRVELDNSKISNTSNMDLTKDVAGNLDKSNVSITGQGGTTRFFKKKQQSGVGQLLEELRGNESVISLESLDSDCSEFVTKRQRKRVRKRKKKNPTYNSDSSLNSSLIVTENPVLKPLNTKACPSLHIKFEEDDDGEVLKPIIISKDEAKDDSELYIENITLKSDLDESKIEKPNIREEDILKSPSMKKMLPKVGDLIAFKILRITDNYTPDISSYLTGKVLEFNNENKKIVFEILSGLDQCEEPKGKLTLESDGNSVKFSSLREFNWVDLIDPRLLYP